MTVASDVESLRALAKDWKDVSDRARIGPCCESDPSPRITALQIEWAAREIENLRAELVSWRSAAVDWQESALASKAESDELRTLNEAFMRGEVEASSVLPPGQTCSCISLTGRTGREGGFLASWACEWDGCTAGRPREGVTVAQLVGGK